MSEQSDLLASISETIADYREGDLPSPTPKHVDRWVSQFNSGVRLPILREMDHVLKSTYFSRGKTKQFLASLFNAERLVGDDPCAFWEGVRFLDIQQDGASQKEMLALFSKVLEQECGLAVEDCGSDPHAFVYLDDAIFSGGRIGNDLVAWISDQAPDEAKLHVIVIATHQGAYYHKNRIREARRESGKKIRFGWWHAMELEDRKKYTDSSDVLRPVSIPADPAVQAYANNLRFSPQLRNAGQRGELGLFSGDAGRHILEQEFLKAGVRIRRMCPNLNDYQRPLGNMVLDTLGFGSLIVTFRNCPNNAPLALWAGSPWYPLFPRTTNSATSLRRFKTLLAKDMI